MKFAFDIETTGLYPEIDEILSLAIVDEDMKMVYSHRFRPEHTESWEDAERINGISPEMVKNEPLFRDCVPEIQSVFDRADAIISYNGKRFDIRFLEAAGLAFPQEHIDVMADMLPWRMKLCVLTEKLDYTFNAHDSAEDAKATMYCYQRLAAGAQIII